MPTKRIFKTFLSLILFSFFNAPELLAQEEQKEIPDPVFLAENSISFALSLPYSFELETTGINARVYYNIKDHLCFGPEFTFLQTNELQVFDVDFVVHYIIDLPKIGIYPAFGLNYTWESSEEHENKEGAGVLWGAGFHRNFKRFTAFAEYTRVDGEISDQFVSIGLFYHLYF